VAVTVNEQIVGEPVDDKPPARRARK
jgi:hypothetical protein